MESPTQLNFSSALDPLGIAIVGASENPARIGGQPIRALLDAGYGGAILPVNPKYETIAGLRCYSSIDAIDQACDLAVIAVPAKAVIQAIEACGRKGIGFAIVLSGGFGETGEAGAIQQANLVKAAKAAKVRVIGPNCQGLINFPSRVYAAFGSIVGELNMPLGPVSMAFQSGGFGFAIATLAAAEGVGFRTCVSTGNEADVTTPDFLDAFVDDPGTKVCSAYIEGVADGRRLIEAGRRALKAGKPILLWKGGNTERGARAAASHTANLTGRYDVYQAAFRQAGIIEVHDVHEMADLFKVFGTGRLPTGPRVGALSVSGGSAIVFADRAIDAGLTVPDFSEETARQLVDIVPAFGSAVNPVDITAGVFNDISLFTRALEVVLEDPAIDQLALLLASIPGETAKVAAQAIADVYTRTNKPILVGWSVRRDRAVEAYEILETAGVPIIPTPVRLASAAAGAARYADIRERLLSRPVWPATTDTTISIGAGLEGALGEDASKDVLAKAGIPVSRDVLVNPEDRPSECVAELTYPVVAKVVSSDIAHKSDVGGVCLGLENAESLDVGVTAMLSKVRRHCPDATIDGVLVSEMISDGVEVIVGVSNDESFGPTVTFGLGGIFAEILRDVTFRVAPFDVDTAYEMIDELRGRAMFDGARGMPPRDKTALAHLLADVSQFAWASRDRVVELDINPVLVRPAESGVIAVDALMVVAKR